MNPLYFNKSYIMQKTATEHHDKMGSENDSRLGTWLKRCQEARDGHYRRAEKLFNLSQLLGFVLVYSTVFVTTFSFIAHDPAKVFWGSIKHQHIVIFIGGIAAVISGIVSQARFGERAEMHRSSAARYANLARDIEELLFKQEEKLLLEGDLPAHINTIIKEWNNLSEDSLLTPHSKARRYYCGHVIIALLFFMMFFSVSGG
ncbi:SLATT domain-containing protein [Pseudoalteromonas sp. OOF1S-7]|uniref:SLATT domain-containing protein n=1 Tax=Pseudoalteromonas sp. OOF1S-7 TaxID=2917757 RepID=UPI001EF559F2|nr:SLATT domain-containing protein [Pseudoalteromonas sp. OOF1S-7]MCG7534086.1 SLATT domain-containing protein [Pseudoalteromonas sp. OOF1S-7]